MANKIVFEASVPNGPLRQGEVISGLTEFIYDPVTEDVDAESHSFCIIASQDCDLLRDYEARRDGEESTIRSVLFLKVDSKEEARNTINSPTWNKVRHNTTDRWHVLEHAEPAQDLAGKGLPPLVVDFRKFFSMPPGEVYRQLEAAEDALRRSVLLSPYREHLQMRMMTYMARVALDRDHVV